MRCIVYEREHFGNKLVEKQEHGTKKTEVWRFCFFMRLCLGGLQQVKFIFGKALHSMFTFLYSEKGFLISGQQLPIPVFIRI